MLEPLTYTIEVPADQETAFNVFTQKMGDWWPLDKRAMSLKDGEKPQCLNVDAQLGGKIVEVSESGKEHYWGSFKTFSPNDSVSMNFHMGMPPENASLVEVDFTALSENHTQVQLVQSNWEAFGDFAEMVYNGYKSGWVIIFETAYKEACGQS